MKRQIKLIISFFFYSAVVIRNRILWLFGRKPAGSCTILYYHSIPRNQRERFAWQMDALLRHARPIPADFRKPLAEGVHHVAVTFDDGFQNVVEHALLELRERNIPATIFITTGWLGRKPGWEMEEGCADRDMFVMTAEQLRELPNELVMIGSHTITHPHLPKIDIERAVEELSGSRRALEALLNEPPALFSFPHGEYNEKLVELCRDVGYERIFTIMPKILRSSEAYVMGRVKVNPDDGHLEFVLKLMGGYRWMVWASTLKRKARILFRGGSQVNAE